MDRYRLRAALLAAAVPPGAFRLAGVHEPTPLPVDFWFLRPGGGGWQIGPYERGEYVVREVLATEGAACARLYEILTGRPAPP
ncbi:MAG: hypothetical protein WCA46_22385 [Actinocatenispora sp.]